MKKTVTVIGVITLLLIGFLPNINGRIAESISVQFINQLNTNHKIIKLLEYQRGFYSSNINLIWTPSKSSGKFQSSIELDCVGSHGYFDYDYACKIRSDGFNTKASSSHPITLIGNIAWFGKTKLSIVVNQLEINNINGAVVEISTGELSVITDKQLSSFNVGGGFASFSVQNEDASLLAKGISFNGKMRINSFNLVIGEIVTFAESVEFGAKNHKDIEVVGVFSDLSVNVITSEKDQDLNFGSHLTSANYSQTQPELLNLTHLDLSFQTDNIDMPQLLLLNNKIDSISPHTESQKNASMLSLLPVFQDLLEPNLSSEGYFSANYNSEPIVVNADLSFVGDLSIGDMFMLKLNPRSVFAKVDSHYTSSIPHQLINNNSFIRNYITNNSWYIRVDQNYISNFDLQDGKANLNMRELSIKEMLALIGRK